MTQFVDDFSANAPLIGTLGTLLATAGVNPNRKGAQVQNQSINQAYVVTDDGNGGSLTVWSLNAASGAGMQGGSWSTQGLMHTGRIRVYGTAGAQIAAGQS